MNPRQVWNHDSTEGSCRVIPKQGVVLVVTDQHGKETVFGFLAYPKALLDVNGRAVLQIANAEKWTYSGHIKSHDLRVRRIVDCFAQEGCLESVKDEFE